MDEDELRDILSRVQFNRTEPDTLRHLVDDAVKKGKRVQTEHAALSKVCGTIYQDLLRRGYVHGEEALRGHVANKVAAGIDGGFYPVGGPGGLWYVPMSVARITFKDGPSSPPTVDIYDARIEEIQETGDWFNIGFQSAVRMMVGENKALMDWGSKKIDSVLFIDGPIVDPPLYRDEAFVDYRTAALKSALDHSLVVGCVKRSRDRFVRDLLVGEGVIDDALKDRFVSDQHLFLYVFTKARESGAKGPLLSRPFFVDNPTPAYPMYAERGIGVAYSFVQKDATTKVLRMDIAYRVDELSQLNIDEVAGSAARNVLDWTIPGQDIPLPVQLADEKCKIRQGCAEVLYQDIISRGRSSDRFGQIVSIHLR